MRSSHLASPESHPQDAEFLLQTVHCCKFVQEIAELALHRDVTGPLQAFSEKQLRDQGHLDEELHALVKQKSVKVPMALDHDLVLKIGVLNDAKTEDFPERYLHELVECLEQMTEMFEDASAESTDAEISALASQHLPELRADLMEAEALETVY